MSVYTLRNARGMEMRVADRGGIILSLVVPDRSGRPGDVVLGFDAVDDYGENPDCIGALAGRYAGRIAHGRFTLDGRTRTLATNHPPHHLHGGRTGFDRVLWSAEKVRDEAGDGVVLRYTSPAGEEGYPGTLEARVRYTLTEAGSVVVDYHATADEATPVNLTQHSYFNLAAGAAPDVLDHRLTIHADRFLPLDATLVPTGELRDVAGTPFDFREPRAIGDRIDEPDEQLRIGGGYDHTFVLGPPGADGLRPAGRVHDPVSGRVLEVRTTEPGLQLYTGNGLDGSRVGKGGFRHGPRAGLALETQHFPDSPNHPGFPSTILRPGAVFQSRTVFAFGTRHD